MMISLASLMARVPFLRSNSYFSKYFKTASFPFSIIGIGGIIIGLLSKCILLLKNGDFFSFICFPLLIRNFSGNIFVIELLLKLKPNKSFNSCKDSISLILLLLKDNVVIDSKYFKVDISEILFPDKFNQFRFINSFNG